VIQWLPVPDSRAVGADLVCLPGDLCRCSLICVAFVLVVPRCACWIYGGGCASWFEFLVPSLRDLWVWGLEACHAVRGLRFEGFDMLLCI
jgi:hypothetical protein